MAGLGKQITDELFAAFSQAAGSVSGEQAAAIQAQATALGQALASLAVMRGKLSEAQTEELFKAHVDAAKAALIFDAGIAALHAPGVLKAGLNVLLTAGLSALGVGWLAPVVQAAVDALDKA